MEGTKWVENSFGGGVLEALGVSPGMSEKGQRCWLLLPWVMLVGCPYLSIPSPSVCGAPTGRSQDGGWCSGVWGPGRTSDRGSWVQSWQLEPMCGVMGKENLKHLTS